MFADSSSTCGSTLASQTKTANAPVGSSRLNAPTIDDAANNEPSPVDSSPRPRFFEEPFEHRDYREYDHQRRVPPEEEVDKKMVNHQVAPLSVFTVQGE